MLLFPSHTLAYSHYLMMIENLIISLCYMVISAGIAYGIWKSRKAGINPVIMTVSAIFFSCALGHGMHVLGMLAFNQAIVWQTAVDLLTVIVAIRFVTYYESFGVLAQIGQIAAANVVLESENLSLQDSLDKLKQTQQLIQAEKMTGLGQLVAGIAHEVNNPISFIHANIAHVSSHVDSLISLVNAYKELYPQSISEIEELDEEMDIAFIQADLPKILNSMRTGTERIRQLVLSLRNFSRKDEAALKTVNVHEGLDSTLLILQHRLQATQKRPDIQVLHRYSSHLPLVECYPSQLNQSFLNLITNAIDAIEDAGRDCTYAELEARADRITLSTEIIEQNYIEISIADSGNGISDAFIERIFEPFFTTKEVGKGTGLGLSISYQIVVEKHGGTLRCQSIPGEETKFVIQIPIRQKASELLERVDDKPLQACA